MAPVPDGAPSDSPATGGGMAPGMLAALEGLRKGLIDTGKRNRLINTPLGKDRAKQLEIEDELSDEVFKTLYSRGKRMTFEASERGSEDAPDDEGSDEVYVPDEQRNPAAGPAAHQVDDKLRTRLTVARLQQRLKGLYRAAKTLEEEQGISVLFLGIGFLRWHESESSEIERFAPLILLPVDLEREGVRSRFKLSYRDQEFEPNHSLRAMLAADFDMELPDLPAGDDWLPSAYFDAVEAMIEAKPRWTVLRDTMELSLYSFARFLMWRDLAPENDWADGEGLGGHALLERLLVSGFESGGSIFAPDENLDKRFPDPRDLGHILDADSSQTQVIAAVREGRSLVVQGPPGTGKSQTIANIISAVARDGKRVLFIAEKRAALDVVHARLDQRGLGPLCLELHSHKASPKHVYAALKQTLDLGEPKAVNEEHYAQVRQVRDELNRTSEVLHKVDEATGETPYGIIGRIAALAEAGCPRPGFELPGSDAWSRDEFAERARAVTSLAELTGAHGSERSHAWRGVRKRLGPLGRRELADHLEQAIERLRALRAALGTAAEAVSATGAASASEADAIASALDSLIAMPAEAPSLLEAVAVVRDPAVVLDLCANVKALQDLREALSAEVIDSALEAGWDDARIAIAASGRSMFRWFSGSYRGAVARLRSVQRGQLPDGLDARLAQLDRLLEYRRRFRSMEQDSGLGQAALGSVWRHDRTDVKAVLPALEWIVARTLALGSGEAVKDQLSAVPPDCDLVALAAELRGAREAWTEIWTAVAAVTELDSAAAFESDSIDAVDLAEIGSRLQAWSGDAHALDDWHRLRTAAEHGSELGMDEIRNRLADGRLGADQAPQALEAVRAESVWKRMVRERPALESIDGAQRTAQVERFKNLDQELQELTSREVALRHFQSLPVGSAGQIGVVRGEISKKSRHMKLRTLLDRAGEAVATIKPVFLMSPLSVAQYLKPGGLSFDLLLIDEASQVRPAEAIGAVLRCRQVVVVGDQRQMPPTAFFDRQVSDEPAEEAPEDEADIMASQVGDMESILSLCDSRSMTGAMLQWHYRSKHPSLIDVSNHEFYDNRLICPPSPERPGESTGLTFVHVDGVYERGRRRNNPEEARVVAEHVLDYARKHPDLTLGVVALSVAQRDTIEEVIERMRAEFPELEAFCKGGRDEGFFIKNLENVQGDERDAIFISIGYGRDAHGYLGQSFGPISSDGGERRLNVLFTRAKRRCCVFSSLRHSDIRLDAAKHAGPRVLKRYLKYAETGELDVPVFTGAEMDSPFEEAVALALQSHGHRVAAQVGSAGFLIDLAVYDPDDEGRFLLAVECDGARYHSSSWARERDRLRQAVLEQKGWIFHRIWSTDWFYNRDAEVAKLLDAIDKARSPSRRETAPASRPQRVAVERAPKAPEAEAPVVRYVEADFPIGERGTWELHEVPAESLAAYVARIVEEEGPVHILEVGRRLTRLWGYRRAGSRIQALVESAARAAVRQRKIHLSADGEGRFLDRCERDGKLPVRNRGAVKSASLRSVDMLPPGEIRAGILAAVERNVGIDVGECAVQVARMLGFKSTSADLRGVVAEHAERLVSEGALARSDEHLRLA